MNTSQSAKQVASITAGQVREQIFGYIDSCATGATCDEVERALGLRHSTASARIRELHQDGRLRYDAEQTRLTSAGCPARVYFTQARHQATVTVTVTMPVAARSSMSLADLQTSIRKALEEL